MSERPRYTLQVNVWIRDNQNGSGLQFNEEVSINANVQQFLLGNGFLEIAKVLGQFHDLAMRFKEEQ